MFQGASLRFCEFVDIQKAIASTAETAAEAEYAVVYVGTTNEVESEGYDRDSMDLPGFQYELIRAVANKNPRTIVVNFSGAPVIMNFVDNVVVSRAVARVLTGKINPSGLLPMSWPKKKSRITHHLEIFPLRTMEFIMLKDLTLAIDIMIEK
jgi:beta-glucosidase